MSNLLDNRVSATVSAPDETAAIGHFNSLDTLFPFLIGLTVTERSSMPKIDSVNRDFVADAIGIIGNNPDYFPAYFNATELSKDYVLYETLGRIRVVAEQFVEKLRDTQMRAGSEAYVTSLTAYRLLQSAAEDGVPGAKTLYDQLKARFEGQGGPGAPANP
jgi:hypothetical protein